MTAARQRWLIAALVLAAFAVGFVVERIARDGDDSAETSAESEDETDATTDAAGSEPTETTSSTTSAPTTTTSTTTTTTAAPAEVVVQVLASDPPTAEEAIGYADVLSNGIVLPSDCGLPYDVPASLPNSPRTYRNGIHQGVDFICLEPGRDAVAALPGRVVVAVGDYQDPTPEDRSAVLDIAGATAGTPPYTLVMLYGNYVVLDHGVIDGVGHVISLYTHLEALDPLMSPGVQVETGQRIGEIGNRGTDTASRNGVRPQSIHLHWEIHIDGLYLSAGLTAEETAAVYRTLFDG
ncbi:MAG: M23 family metallopeptidase [Actinomycetota bacterium]